MLTQRQNFIQRTAWRVLNDCCISSKVQTAVETERPYELDQHSFSLHSGAVERVSVVYMVTKHCTDVYGFHWVLVVCVCMVSSETDIDRQQPDVFTLRGKTDAGARKPRSIIDRCVVDFVDSFWCEPGRCCIFTCSPSSLSALRSQN